MKEEQGQKHTPGPWSLSSIGFKMNDGAVPVMAPDTTGAGEKKRVALVDCQSKFKRGEGHKSECAERHANARLISAAPDLLEALQECLLEHGGFTIKGECERKARAAIAKASGRP